MNTSGSFVGGDINVNVKSDRFNRRQYFTPQGRLGTVGAWGSAANDKIDDYENFSAEKDREAYVRAHSPHGIYDVPFGPLDYEKYLIPLPPVLRMVKFAKAGSTGGRYLYHYTNSEVKAKNIAEIGLRTEYSADGFIYLTNKSGLSSMQAQIELAFPANRALPNSILRVDVSGLRPTLTRRVTGNLPGMNAGGGTEFLYNSDIPASAVKRIK